VELQLEPIRSIVGAYVLAYMPDSTTTDHLMMEFRGDLASIEFTEKGKGRDERKKEKYINKTRKQRKPKESNILK